MRNRCKDELICSPDTGQTRSSAPTTQEQLCALCVLCGYTLLGHIQYAPTAFLSIKESIMGKFNRLLVEKIEELIEEDNYTITEICGSVGISRKVFYERKATKPSFAEALDKAVEALEEKTKSPPVDRGRSWKDTGR